jgi:superoxide dismutase
MLSPEFLRMQAGRPDYLAAWLDKLVNWRFAEKNLG